MARLTDRHGLRPRPVLGHRRGGIVVAFLFQIYVNVGMTMGIAASPAIPLPFVSVGGSSMIANLAAMGVLLSIHTRGTPFSGA
jgi:rod shape determining protein RodA